MKKAAALLLSILLLISMSACDFLFRQDNPVTETSTPAPITTPDSVVPSPPVPTAEPSATPSPTPETEDPVPSATPTPSISPDNTQELTAYVSGASVTVPATSYSAELLENKLKFSILYDFAAYNVEFENNAYLFTPSAEDAVATDYMEISFIHSGESESILPSFADSYIDFSDIEFASYTPIGKTHINSESIIAYNSDQYLNAYLIDTNGGVVSIVISSTSQYSNSFAWFNAMLGTLELK